MIDEDPGKPNEEYFQHIDWIIQKAESMGLWFGILPTWGDKVGHAHGAGPAPFTPQNAWECGHFLGGRYREANLVWTLGGDRNVDDTEQFEIWRAAKPICSRAPWPTGRCCSFDRVSRRTGRWLDHGADRPIARRI